MSDRPLFSPSVLSGAAVRLREPRVLLSTSLFLTAIVVVAGLTLRGMQADQTAGTDEINDSQLDAALVSLAAVGVSDSANPQAFDAGSPPLSGLPEPPGHDTEPAPLFSIDEASPAIMFEPAKVTTGPLFGTARSVPSHSGIAAPSAPDQSAYEGLSGVITADGKQEISSPTSPFGGPAPSVDQARTTLPNTAIRPVNGVRAAAWLTGTIE